MSIWKHRKLNHLKPVGVATFIRMTSMKTDIVIIAPNTAALTDILHWIKLPHDKVKFDDVEIIPHKPKRKKGEPHHRKFERLCPAPPDLEKTPCLNTSNT